MTPIALLTDFGLSDPYVGVMKAVILRAHPTAQLLDLTHQIDPQNVRQAAFALLNSYRYFPAGTVFLVVVDPGVGSTRRPIIAEAGGYRFVAPDNGVISYALADLGEYRAVEIALSDHARAEISNTFHGRDVFAPAAAALASGAALDVLGEPLDRALMLPQPGLTVESQRLIGEIVSIDRFGNLITSIGHLRWSTPERLTLTPAFGGGASTVLVSAEHAVLSLAGETITGVRHTYSEAERGGLLMLVGSSAYLEISVNQGSAARRLDAHIGDRVELHIGGLHAAVHH